MLRNRSWTHQYLEDRHLREPSKEFWKGAAGVIEGNQNTVVSWKPKESVSRSREWIAPSKLLCFELKCLNNTDDDFEHLTKHLMALTKHLNDVEGEKNVLGWIQERRKGEKWKPLSWVTPEESDYNGKEVCMYTWM